MSVHIWMGSTLYPIGGHEILVFYLRRFGYFLRTSNFLAGRIVMSPLWNIITVQRFMMTRVARWVLYHVQGLLRGIVGSIIHFSSYSIIMIHSAQVGFGFIAFRRFP
jgi:hypothetical protein